MYLWKDCLLLFSAQQLLYFIGQRPVEDGEPPPSACAPAPASQPVVAHPRSLNISLGAAVCLFPRGGAAWPGRAWLRHFVERLAGNPATEAPDQLSRSDGGSAAAPPRSEAPTPPIRTSTLPLGSRAEHRRRRWLRAPVSLPHERSLVLFSLELMDDRHTTVSNQLIEEIFLMRCTQQNNLS